MKLILKNHAYKCYAGLGPKLKSLEHIASVYRAKAWLNSTMSPIWVGSKILSSHLKELEAWFAKQGKLRHFEATSPYLNVLGSELSSESKKVLESAEWVRKDSQSSLLLWTDTLPLKLNNKIHLVMGSPTDKHLWKVFSRELIQNFGLRKVFLLDLMTLLVDVSANTRVVLLRSGKNEVVGSGLVTTKNQHAFLWCGSISKKWRSKGYWKQLVAARQHVSAMDGAKYWATTTVNPRIMKSSRLRCPVYVYEKKSLPAGGIP